MGDWLALSNPKLKQSDGQLSQKGWGSIKGEFQRLLKLLEGKNKSVIFVSHEKEEKVDDKVNKRIDVSGSTGKDVIKELDFVGYMSIQGGKRTIDLSPNDSFFTKNSLGISSFFEYKPLTGVNSFLSQAIFDAYNEKLKKDEQLSKEYDLLIEELKTKINNINNVDELNLYFSLIYNKHEKLWSSYEMEANFLKIKSEELLKGINKVENLNSFYNDIYLPMKDLAIDKLLLKTKSEELGCWFDVKAKEFKARVKEEIKVEEIKEEVKND
jgi:hypothetical protein